MRRYATDALHTSGPAALLLLLSALATSVAALPNPTAGEARAQTNEKRLVGTIVSVDRMIAEFAMTVAGEAPDSTRVPPEPRTTRRLVRITDGTRYSRGGQLDDNYNPADLRVGRPVSVVGTDLRDYLGRFLARVIVFDGPADSGTPAEAPRRPIVQFNQSHQALFEFNDIADLCAARGLDCLMTDMSLTAKINDLAETDALFIRQTGGSVAFTDDEVRLLRAFVADGGGLFLYGTATQPITKVAQAFGAAFLAGHAKGPLVPSAHLRERGAPAAIPIADDATNGRVSGPDGATVFLSGSDSTPVAVAFAYGKGKVVALCDEGGSFNIRADRPAQKAAVRACYETMLRWLVPGSGTPARRQGNLIFFRGEIVVPLDGLYVQYPKTLETWAKHYIQYLPLAVQTVKAVCGTVQGPRALEVNFTAGAANGGEMLVGICIGPEVLNDFVHILGHELGHGYCGLLPGAFGEGMPSVVADRVALAYNNPTFAGVVADKQRWRAQVLGREDPTGHDLDITNEKMDYKAFHIHMEKAQMVVNELARRYGEGFITRLLQITRAMKGKEPPTMQEWLYYMELAAGADLRGWFREIGATHSRPAEIPAAVLAQRVKEYLGQ